MPRTLDWDMWVIIFLAILVSMWIFVGPAIGGGPEQRVQDQPEPAVVVAEPADDGGLHISITGSGWRWVWNYAIPGAGGMVLLGAGAYWRRHLKSRPPPA